MMSDYDDEVAARIETNENNGALKESTKEFMCESAKAMYSYNYSWLGRPIIQYPQDIVAMQELIWKIKPDLIIETGIAHGGSLILSASVMAMLDVSEAIKNGTAYDPKKSKRKVLGIDIDIRSHNDAAIKAHPMANYIQMMEGSSIAPDMIAKVKEVASKHEKVLICLDSNHTHEHVLAELEAYAPLTSVGSYCVVFDTIVEDLPAEMFSDRPWAPGDNPKTAVWKFIENNIDFQIDHSIENKLQITVAPDGFLRRVK